VHVTKSLFEYIGKLLLNAQCVLLNTTHFFLHCLQLAFNNFLLFAQRDVFFVGVVESVTISLLDVNKTGLALFRPPAAFCLLQSLDYTHAAVSYTCLLVEILIRFLVFFTLTKVLGTLFDGNAFVVRQEVLSV